MTTNTKSLRTGLAFLLAFFAAFSQAETNPTEGLVNYETPHVYPIELTPDRSRLLAVNTAGHTLEVFSLANGADAPELEKTIPVGLDPVTVRARSNSQAWVVNHISDTVSVVDLDAGVVIATLETENEPCDVVFAGSPLRAFVTCSEANSVQVFSTTNFEASPQKIAIEGEDPRALAVSNDGQTVYAAIFESGNGSTVLNGRPAVDASDVVSRPEGPYQGQNPPPNVGNQFSPAINPAIGTPPRVSMIVKKNAAGNWMDDNNGNWSIFVSGGLSTLTRRVSGWDLQDNDVAVINAQTLGVTYQKRLMNMVMAIGVNPVTGEISTVGTEATNEVRFEPVLNGKFLRVNVATFPQNGAATVRDLNPHLNYSTATVSQTLRQQSIGDPRGIAWNGAGNQAFVTGMGSNNVVVTNKNGTRLGRIDVGQGPTGIVLDNATDLGYVMNKFDGTISVIDLNGQSEIGQVAFDDPTPDVIKNGRPFLYDTHLTSGLGHVSCASCHVDARTDRLAWDLGNPAGQIEQVARASNSTGADTGTTVNVSPMKGPMVTQTLQDIMAHPSLHWRGDRGELADFNPAFQGLMGRPNQLSSGEMQAFGDFLNTIHLPPNPYRNLDDSRPTSVTLPNGQTVTSPSLTALRGNNNRNNNCLQCHNGGGTRNFASNPELGQAFVAPAFPGFYDKLGYWQNSQTGSTNGFGFFHDGSEHLGAAARITSAEASDDFIAEILTLEGPSGGLTASEQRQDTHAGVGTQVTVNGTISSSENALLDQLINIANTSPHAELIAKIADGGSVRGFLLQSGNSFLPDVAADPNKTTADLINLASLGNAVTFTLVANGTGTRLGIDADLDGTLDGDEDPGGGGGGGGGNGGDNLLENPGFENGLTNWETWNPVTISNSAHEGQNAAVTSGSLLYQIVAVDPGDDLTLGGFYKTTGDDWLEGGLLFFDAAGNIIADATTQLTDSAAYTNFEVSGTAPAGTAFVWVYFWASGGQLFVDDLSLTNEVGGGGGGTDPNPTVTLSTLSSSVTGPFSVQIDFSENVSGLSPADFQITNGTAGGLSAASGQTYFITVTPQMAGLVTVSLPGNSAQTGDGRGNDASNTLTVSFNDTPPPPAPAESRTLTLNSGQSQSVTFANSFNSPVVFATVEMAVTATPVSAEISNVTSSGFEIKIVRLDGQSGTVSNVKVNTLVLEEGVYTVGQHGIKMEVGRVDVDNPGSFWNGWNSNNSVPVTLNQSYQNPVVIGQLQTAFSTGWMGFWSHGAAFDQAASSSSISVGHHIGKDPSTWREFVESTGYAIIESGSGTFAGKPFEAGRVTSVGASAKTVSLGGNVTVNPRPILGWTGVNSEDGNLPILLEPATASQMKIAIDQDELFDDGTAPSETVDYFIFGD